MIGTLLLLGGSGLAQAQQVLHVPADHATIQGAIDAALSGDTVLVAPGTYVELINFSGKDISVLGSGGAAVTTIDGDGAGTVVLFENNESGDATLDGFTITGGKGTFRPAGGIYCGGADPLIRHCVITRNEGSSSLGGAGGITASYGAPLIRDCTIRRNTAGSRSGANNEAPGGIASRWDSYPVIIDTLLEENTGANGGPGGLQCTYGARARAVNTIFRANIGGDSDGDCETAGPGAARIAQSHATFVNSTFEANVAGDGREGAGAVLVESSGVVVDQCVFVDNVGSQCANGPTLRGGPGAIHIKHSSPRIVFSEFRANRGGRGAAGAIWSKGQSGPEILDSIFVDNRAGSGLSEAPGAVSLNGPGPSIDLVARCVFQGNMGADGAGHGGAGALKTGRPGMIVDCMFEGNRGGFGGHGVGGAGVMSIANFAEVSVVACRMLNNLGGAAAGDAGAVNSGRGGPGAIQVLDMTASFISCLIASNEGGSSVDFAPGAGAISCEDGDTLVLNCTLADNRAGSGPGTARPSGVHVKSGAQFETVNSILRNDAGNAELTGNVVVRNCLVRGGAPGAGNINLDPLFVDAAHNDFHLLCASPCHNSGTLDGVNLTSTDFDGEARFFGGAVDIGADEYHAAGAGSTYCTSTVNSTGMAAVIDALGCNAISDGVLPLRASPLPETFGAFFYGAGQTQVPFANGFRCVGGGTVFRLAFRPIVAGQLAMDLNYSTPPQPVGQILSGSTWNFQAYFRDPQAGGSQVNLSNGLQVTFVD